MEDRSKNIETLDSKSVGELKAMAYDTLVYIENAQKHLQEINHHIAKKLQEEPIKENGS